MANSKYSSVISDSKGRAVLACTTKGSEAIIAQKDKDIAFVQNVFAINSEAKNELLWHTADDRGMYRPKEIFALKGYIRALKRDEKENYEHLEIPNIQKINWTLRDGRKVEIVQGELSVSSFYGAFELSLKLGTALNLGTCEVTFTTKYNNSQVEHVHKFEVQEVNNKKLTKILIFFLQFRRPDFKAEVALLSNEPYLYDTFALVKGSASYYAGGALPESAVTWTVSSTQASFVPPGLSKYTFLSPKHIATPAISNVVLSKNFKAATDGDGLHHVKVLVFYIV